MIGSEELDDDDDDDNEEEEEEKEEKEEEEEEEEKKTIATTRPYHETRTEQDSRTLRASTRLQRHEAPLVHVNDHGTMICRRGLVGENNSPLFSPFSSSTL
ncbi:hypothetical protein M0802_016299 [Mischocyttarus mexicanus]|nr:hypothetical protein M0802_016299 [Mischocyttarus mexicanus]